VLISSFSRHFALKIDITDVTEGRYLTLKVDNFPPKSMKLNLMEAGHKPYIYDRYIFR